MLPEGAREGMESYRTFIRSCLSITDNLVNDKAVHPENVVIHDGEDPYFVVAADKGTATFSDVANAIALERNFWLGDAFASGGSNGYDHKAMGITAKGAWLSVQRHFREQGVDVQTQRPPLTHPLVQVGPSEAVDALFAVPHRLEVVPDRLLERAAIAGDIESLLLCRND